MSNLNTYVFPSLKNLGNLPVIDVAGDNRINHFCDWFISNNLSPLVPPIWQDFVIKFSNHYPAKFGKNAAHEDVILIVHYADNKTAFVVCVCINGKKLFTAVVNYADQLGAGLKATVQCTDINRHLAEHYCMSACTAVLAIQSYVLYHKPEDISVIVDSPRRPAQTSKNRPKATSIRSAVRHYVRIGEQEKIPKLRHYNAIQWQVRGHYRRIFNPDGSVKKLTYIAPHYAKRGNKKATAKTFILPDDSKEDQK